MALEKARWQETEGSGCLFGWQPCCPAKDFWFIGLPSNWCQTHPLCFGMAASFCLCLQRHAFKRFVHLDTCTSPHPDVCAEAAFGRMALLTKFGRVARSTLTWTMSRPPTFKFLAAWAACFVSKDFLLSPSEKRGCYPISLGISAPKRFSGEAALFVDRGIMMPDRQLELALPASGRQSRMRVERTQKANLMLSCDWNIKRPKVSVRPPWGTRLWQKHSILHYFSPASRFTALIPWHIF